MALKEELAERLAFLGLAETDLQLLAELRPLFETHADALVEAFYGHLLSFETTRRPLADPGVKARLLRKQREYLLSLAGPTLDESYVADRVAIGEAHVRIGLEPRWYLGAYAYYFSLLVPRICAAFGKDPERTERTVSALLKLLMLDAQLAMEAFIQGRQSELDYLNRELSALSRSLAREVDAQTVSLRQTERRAREAEELASVATLVAGLAHEVGTPLGVIRGHAEALDAAVEGERAQWRLRTIREQIDRISNIIQALLNIARPRETVRVEVSVEEVLESTLAFLSERLRRRGVEVQRSFEPTRPILGDPEKLQQLFLNLFLNASDAMPQGGTLTVALESADPDQLEVRIRDSGVGIPPDDLARIFEPFFTTKPTGRGSGLGLMVARGIVLDHGGDMVAASQVGHGTEFRILLPVRPPIAASPRGSK